MQQIMEMASSIGLQPSVENAEQVTQVLHKAEAKDARQETLVRALLPYLQPKRQARLERAMQIAHVSRLAGAALRSAPAMIFPTEEGNTDV